MTQANKYTMIQMFMCEKNGREGGWKEKGGEGEESMWLREVEQKQKREVETLETTLHSL